MHVSQGSGAVSPILDVLQIADTGNPKKRCRGFSCVALGHTWAPLKELLLPTLVLWHKPKCLGRVQSPTWAVWLKTPAFTHPKQADLSGIAVGPWKMDLEM